MKKFHFSLDAALRVRLVELRAAETKLTELVAQEQRIRRSLDVIVLERRDASGYVQQHPGDGLALRALPSYFLGLEMRRANLTRSLETVTALIREQRALVTDLQRKVKLLNKLRERRMSEWQRESDREIEIAAQESWLASHAGVRKFRDP